MSFDFFTLCYDQYKQEMNDADWLYQKVSFMVIVIPLLGTFMVKLGRIDILNLAFLRCDVFAFYLFTVMAAISLTVSVIFLVMSVYPRHYKTLADMAVWSTWRDDYLKYLSENEKRNGGDESIETTLVKNIEKRLIESQPINAKINERRRKAFKKSILFSSIALSALGIQAFFYLVLKIQGI